MNFEAFLERMIVYILHELKKPRDIVRGVRNLKDPTTNFKRKNLPKNLTAIQLKSDVDVAIQKERIKLYIIWEAHTKNNMDKIYGLVKGQCLTSF